jgi:hypothetical protein
MSAALGVTAPWYAEALRRAATLMLALAERLERAAPERQPLEPWVDIPPPDERLFELRNRILNGYY